MDTYMVLLRLVHIVTGIFWVGSDLLMVFFVEPTVIALGPNGGAFMQRLTKHTRYAQAMPISALLTVVTGVLLFVLGLGSLAGILAFLDGMIFIGPTVNRIEQLGTEMTEQQGPPSGDQLAEKQQLQGRMNRAYQYMIILTMLSIVGMSSARYIWS
jgi:hypothetical protein